MTTPEPPTTPEPARPTGWRGRLPRRRWLLVGGVLAAVLVVGAVAAALVGGDRHDRFGHRGGPWGGDAAYQLGLAGDGLELGIDGPGGPDRPGPGGFGEREDRGDRGDRGPRGARFANTAALTGSVVSTDGGNLVLAADGAGPVTVPTNDRTRVIGAGSRAVTGLQPGDRVVVRVGGDKVAVAVFVPIARASGTVTALEGDRATLVRPNGLTEVVDVSGLAAKPKVGDLVVVQGKAAEGGGALKAETLRTLPKAS